MSYFKASNPNYVTLAQLIFHISLLQLSSATSVNGVNGCVDKRGPFHRSWVLGVILIQLCPKPMPKFCTTKPCQKLGVGHKRFCVGCEPVYEIVISPLYYFPLVCFKSLLS